MVGPHGSLNSNAVCPLCLQVTSIPGENSMECYSMLSSAKIDEINMVPVLCKNAPYCQTSVPLLHLSSHEDNCPVSISAPALLSGPPSHPNAFISHHPPHQAFSVPCSSCNVFMHPSQSILSYVCSTACLERPYALILSLLEENNHLHDFITEKNLDYILPRSAAVYAAFDFIQSKNSRPPLALSCIRTCRVFPLLTLCSPNKATPCRYEVLRHACL